MRSYLRILVSQLLPYNALLVPFSYFFIKNNFNPPSHQQDQKLQQFFWWVSLSSRYTGGAEGKLANDFKRMDAILAGEKPSYIGEELRLTVDDIKGQWFSASDAFCKAIICLLVYHQPRSFQNNSMVKIDNSWLRRADSKNYHHFFPKSYLRKKGVEDWEANSVANITIVDDYLNKRRIGGRAPSAYMKEFSDANPNLDEAMKTHLIMDLRDFGVWNDDYERFIEKRTQVIFDELSKRLP